MGDYVLGWAAEAAVRYDLPILVYRPERNAFKYPLMRRMFHVAVEGHPLGEHVMWFDDDAYLEPGFRWRRMLEYAADKDMIGQLQYWFIQGRQFEWVKRQSWYNPEVGEPLVVRGRPSFLFAQGSWWVIRSEVLRKYDWPVPQLRHNGGDGVWATALSAAAAGRPAPYDERVKCATRTSRRRVPRPPPRRQRAAAGSGPRGGGKRDLGFQDFRVSLRGLYAAGLAGDVGCGVRGKRASPRRGAGKRRIDRQLGGVA